MAYYVGSDGSMHVYEIASPNTVMLDNGVEIPDPPADGEFFATKESAAKYAELVQRMSLAEAKKAHSMWLTEKLIWEL